MNKLLSILSALSMAAGQMQILDVEVCPVSVVVQPIVFIRKTPVHLITEICEETILTLGSTLFTVTSVPTVLETTFEVTKTVTSTVTVSSEGQSGLKQPTTTDSGTESGIQIGTTGTGKSSLHNSFSNTDNSLPQPNTATTARSSSVEATSSGKSASSTDAGPSRAFSSASSTANTPVTSAGQSSPGVSTSTASSTERGSSVHIVSTTNSVEQESSGTLSSTRQSSGPPRSPTSSTEQGSLGTFSSTGDSSGPTTGSTVATTDTPSPPTETSQMQPSRTSSTEQDSATSASLCIVTATAVPECCLNGLPDGCEALEDTNGLALKPVIPACEKALGSYITDDMKECWQGEITSKSRGEYIADCLIYELEDCCITQLPQDCKDLRGVSGSAVVDGADKCRYALGPFVHGIASPCLDKDKITPETRGSSIVDCLEVAYGFRSGPVTITDGNICPRTTSA